MMKNSTIAQIADVLAKSIRVALFCHTAPDGDTLGSAVSLALALEKQGRTVGLFCDSPMPHSLRILPLFDRFKQEFTMEQPYVSIAIDCGDEGRLGEMLPAFFAGQDRINIDHHRTNTGFGELNRVDPAAPATICVVWPLIRALGVQPDAQMGLAGYAALSTDTGNFTFGNTTPQAFALAAELLETGFDLASTAQSLFRERTAVRARILGLCATRMQLFEEDKIAVSGMELTDFEQLGAMDSDSEGAVGFLRDIDTVEAAAFLREVAPGEFKVSLRSTLMDVSAIAQRFEGGGHKNAAGCKVNGTLPEALNIMAEALRQELLKD